MKRLLAFCDEWMLPLAMLIGVVFYQAVSRMAFLTPYLIFMMLFVTFSKIPLSQMKFKRQHLYLLLFQIGVSSLAYFIILPFHPVLAQGAFICLFAPTATAAPVITGMLKGDVAFLTTYSLLCNLLVAITAPFFFSMMGAEQDISFFASVLHLGAEVLPIILIPLISAMLIRNFLPRLNRTVTHVPKLAFYLWALAIVIVMGNTVNFVKSQSSNEYFVEIMLGLIALPICLFQFVVGWRIGRKFGDTVSSGQALGQKNTILAIWMVQTYLNPIASIAPAAYVIWQNLMNSYQLMIQSRKDKLEHKQTNL